jgi:hypothetical protein
VKKKRYLAGEEAVADCVATMSADLILHASLMMMVVVVVVAVEPVGPVLGLV